MSDNSVTLVGSLVRDPTVTIVGKGTPMCRFTISISYKYRDTSDKQKKDAVSFYEVRCFKELAVNFVESCRRGDSVIVIGKLTSREFARDGQSVHVVEVLAQHAGLDLLTTTIPFDESP